MKVNQNPPWLIWLKKLGWAGFLFFLLKGLVWVAIFAGVWKCNH